MQVFNHLFHNHNVSRCAQHNDKKQNFKRVSSSDKEKEKVVEKDEDRNTDESAQPQHDENVES